MEVSPRYRSGFGTAIARFAGLSDSVRSIKDGIEKWREGSRMLRPSPLAPLPNWRGGCSGCALSADRDVRAPHAGMRSDRIEVHVEGKAKPLHLR